MSNDREVNFLWFVLTTRVKIFGESIFAITPELSFETKILFMFGIHACPFEVSFNSLEASLSHYENLYFASRK